MGDVLRNLLSGFMSEKCFNEFFVNFNFLEVNCLKETISKALGAGIIVGSAFVKFPQILKIYRAKSAEGLSVIGLMLELIALTSAASYNFAKGYPFSSWGESCFLMLETAVILFMVLLYSNRFKHANAFAACYSMIVYVLSNGFVPVSTLWSMQIANVPIVVTGKLIQAYKNYQNGHTGQLSAITVNLIFLGGVARIFTSMQETGDPVIIFTFVMASIVNGIIAAQILYYWNATKKFEDSKKKSH